MINQDRHWVCWSHSQQCFNIETETRGIQTNLRAFFQGRPMDYIVIGAFDAIEKAYDHIQWLESEKERLAR